MSKNVVFCVLQINLTPIIAALREKLCFTKNEDVRKVS